jgi:hypothetical protein
LDCFYSQFALCGFTQHEIITTYVGPQSGIPAADTTTHAHIYVDLSGGHNTGLAIVNPANINASIEINAFLNIADGGGYVTQFLLIGASGESSATLNYYSEEGTPLAIGK